MRFCLFRRKRDEATATADYLHMIRHLALIDRDLQLTLARCAGIDTKLARLSNNAAIHFGHLYETRIVDFRDERSAQQFNAIQRSINDVRAHLGGHKFNAERTVAVRLVRYAGAQFGFAGRLNGRLEGLAGFDE